VASLPSAFYPTGIPKRQPKYGEQSSCQARTRAHEGLPSPCLLMVFPIRKANKRKPTTPEAKESTRRAQNSLTSD
jgi:hypothetical protein